VTEEDAQKLFGDGLDLIDERRWNAAEQVGRRLVWMRFTGGYEIIATVQNSRKEHDAAIATLEAGLSHKPIWRLANLLGNFLSDSGQYEEALEMYRQSAGMFGDQPHVTALNRAIALGRCARDEEARTIIAGLLEHKNEDIEFERKIAAVARDLRE
jgi:tetratricopeptide (TPR) repeat protein